MGHTLPSRGTLLLAKVEKLSQTAIRRDSNTDMETFGDHSDIFYPELSLHMKHMGYLSPTMNSYDNKHYIKEYVLDCMLLNVYRLFLNITIQHVCYHFNHGLHSTFLEIEQDIDEIFN